MGRLLMKAENVSKTYTESGRLFSRGRHLKPALKDVSLQICHGETLGLVGESGCGKSTLGKCLLRAVSPTTGKIMLNTEGENYIDLARLPDRELRPYRSRMQMIFQDPFNSLNPNMTVRDLIGEPLLFSGHYDPKLYEETVASLMNDVGLDKRCMGRYSHAFSGGQRQRICIARAIATHPEFIVCDEAVSALDVSIRAQIINLLMDLQESRGIAYLFIAHDLSVVRHISARVAVMYDGNIVETGKTGDVFEYTAHPYTRLLLESVPSFDPARRKEPDALETSAAEDMILMNEAGSAAGGCAFAPRCAYGKSTGKCLEQSPGLKDLGGGHFAACWLHK
jgi:peptide/nickel transport system ATP-binding protein